MSKISVATRFSYTKYTTRFSYMKIHIWNYQNSHMKWISYVKFPFSYVNYITSYIII